MILQLIPASPPQHLLVQPCDCILIPHVVSIQCQALYVSGDCWGIMIVHCQFSLAWDRGANKWPRGEVPLCVHAQIGFHCAGHVCPLCCARVGMGHNGLQGQESSSQGSLPHGGSHPGKNPNLAESSRDVSSHPSQGPPRGMELCVLHFHFLERTAVFHSEFIDLQPAWKIWYKRSDGSFFCEVQSSTCYKREDMAKMAFRAAPPTLLACL